ncbi:hypothetical protein HMPREF9946_02978, partial [Acetobacteraceae bacterium AT-5844]
MPVRRPFLLAGVALLPLLGQAAAAQEPPTGSGPVRVRTGQHTDRGRIVLHLGNVPPYAVRKVSGGFELRLRGQYPLDLSTIRRLNELAGIEGRQEGGETVVLLRTEGEQNAEAGAFDGMLYVDLRPAGAARSATALEAAQRRLLDDAVRLGLMKPEQAAAMLQAARPGSSPAEPASPPPAEPARVAAAAPVTVPAPASPSAPPQQVATPSPAPEARLSMPDDLAALREAVIAKLAVLNGIQSPPSSGPQPAMASPQPQPQPQPQ